MDLETLALIGEFVGGIAVIITIVYLAYQTRQTRLLLAQSNQQQTASMLRANIDGWNETFSSIMSMNESLSVYKRMRCGTELVGDDLQRAELIAYKLFLNLENLILQNAQTPFVEGVDDILGAVVRHRVLEILRSDCMLAWWEREKIAFSPQFGSNVDQVLSREGMAAIRTDGHSSKHHHD